MVWWLIASIIKVSSLLPLSSKVTAKLLYKSLQGHWYHSKTSTKIDRRMNSSYKRALKTYHAPSQLRTIQVCFLVLVLIFIAAKTLESKHPKFMRTIEEIGGPQTTTSYNNILSSSLGYKRSTHGLATSSS